MDSPDIIKLRDQTMEGQIKKTLSADDIIRDAHEKALLSIGEQYNKDDDVRSQRSNALISPAGIRKNDSLRGRNFEDENKKVRDEAKKKREEKRMGTETDTGSLRVHEHTQHKPLSIADLKEMRKSFSKEPVAKSPDVIRKVVSKEKKERKEKRKDKKRREPMKEEQLIEMKKVVLKELSDSQLLKIIERKRSITVKNPIWGELIQPTNPIFKEKANNGIAIEVKPALETLKEVKNPIFGLSLPGVNKPEEITTLAPRSRSSSESRKTNSGASSANTSPRSSVNGDVIARTKSEEGRRSPSTIRIGSRGNSRSNSNADETTQPAEIVIHPGYSLSNLKISADTGSEITWSKEQQQNEEVKLSATTQAKVEAMKLYLNEYYYSLFHYLQDRQTRLNEVKQSLNKSQMLQYAEFFHNENENLRKRRARLKILDFQHLATIGKGGFGNVFLVRHKASGGTFALKRMDKSRMNQKNQIERILTEKEVLSKTLESPWLVHLHSSFQDADHFYLVMEYVPGGDLASMLTNIGPIPQQDAVFYIAEMILAVSALHKMGYIHRDLKPGNFLIDGKGHIKLADFGLSKKGMKDLFRNTLQIKQQTLSLKRLDSVREFQKRSQYYIDNRNKQLAYSIVGSCDYMALELVMGQGYDFSVDWWSIGAIMFEFIMGVPPFFAESPAEVFSNVLDYNRVLSDWEATFAEQPEKPMDDTCWNFIKSLLSPPENRLGHDRGAEEILSHPLFKDVNTRHIRETTAPFVPQLSSDTDLSYFDREGLEEEVLPLSPSFKPLHQHVEGFTFKMPSTSKNNVV